MRRFILPVRGSSAHETLALPSSAASAAIPPSWPITVPLLPQYRLKALIYYHKMRSMVSGEIYCWTYISQGLSQLGQKEVVFTVRRRIATEREQDYHPEPLKWFKFLYSLSQEGRIVDNFQPTTFQAPLFLDRSDFKMIIYCPATTINNVPLSYLPRERLHAIPLTESEGEVAQFYGAMRALSHLGFSERWFPFQPWIDRDRKPCITMADMEGTLRGKISFQRVLEVSVFKRGSDIVVYVPQRAEEYMKDALELLDPSHVVPLESFMYKHADSGMIWKNEYREPRAYSIGTNNSCMNLGFIVFCPEQDENWLQRDEDGYTFFLTKPTWMKIRRAIEEAKPVTVPAGNGLRFCLEYASQHKETRTSKTFGTRAPGTCKTCMLTRKFEPQSTRLTMEEGLQSPQSSLILDISTTAPVTTLKTLQQDAENGCDKCTLLWKGINAHLSYCDGQETGLIYFSGNETRLYCAIGLRLGRSPVLEFFSCELEPCPWLTPQKSSKAPLVTASDENVKIAREWLRACEESHNSCAVGQATSLPTRVLDLGTYGDGTEDMHLYESHGETRSFGTLSHCWGSIQPPKTTKATIGARKAGIQFTELPKTFQDAVVFFRKLKLRYLWIDSLCIIQDDDEDWQKEAASMAEIYGNSRLTIAVPGAGDCSEGCFMGGSPRQHAQKVRWPGVNGEGSYPVYIRHSLEHTPFYDADQTRVNSTVLNRAWVHQERLLSRRILYFGKTELIWKCRETCGCQCGYGFLVPRENNTPTIGCTTRIKE